MVHKDAPVPRIPCVLIVFFDVEVVRKTLEGLQPFCDRLEIIVVENASPHSSAIRDVVLGFMKSGLVTRYFFFLQNISLNAYDVILRREIDGSKHEFVLVSDGDFEPLDPDWLNEMVHVLRSHDEVYCIAGSIDTANLPVNNFGESTKDWVPPPIADRGEYLEALSGMFVLLFRGQELATTLNYLAGSGEKFLNPGLHDYCYRICERRWAKTKRARFRHLAWDSYQDLNHPYTQFKLSKSFVQHFRLDRTSDYIEITDAKDMRGLGETTWAELERMATSRAEVQAELARMTAFHAAVTAELGRMTVSRAEVMAELERMTASRAEVMAELERMIASRAEVMAELDRMIASRAEVMAELERMIVSRAEVMAELERMAVSRAEVMAELERMAVSRAEVIAELERMAVSRAEVMAELERLSAAHNQLEKSYAEDRDTLQSTLQEKLVLQARHDKIINSRSWRMTAPLRSALARARRFTQ